jgi:hypothetical protein
MKTIVRRFGRVPATMSQKNPIRSLYFLIPSDKRSSGLSMLHHSVMGFIFVKAQIQECAEFGKRFWNHIEQRYDIISIH